MPATASDLDALMAAILADPADDAPRLVYADALRDAGQYERAELIDVQVEIAAIEAGKVSPFVLSKLRDREKELWGDYADSPMREALRRECPLLRAMNVLPGAWIHPDVHNGEPLAIVLKGFVAELRGPLAALIGGPCGRCEGRGEYEAPDPASGRTTGEWLSRCPACSGTSRVSGLGAVARAMPVEWVGVTDKRPDRMNVNGQILYFWTAARHDESVRMMHDRLPRELFSLMRPGEIEFSRNFDTEAAAHAALSAAVLAMLRAVARPPEGG